jgi:prepilin peptidase CpaA
MPSQTLLDLALIVVLTAAGVRDLMVRRIPNRLLLGALTAAAMLHLFSGSPLTFITTGVAGLFTGLAVFLPLYLLRGMAAGDVKLMATVGFFTGPHLALEIAAATCCLGGVMALVLVLAQGNALRALRNIKDLLRPLVFRAAGMPLAAEPQRRRSVGSMPYGVAIAFGSLGVLWFRHM